MIPKEVVLNFFETICNQKDLETAKQYLDEDVLIHSMVGDYAGADSLVKVFDQWNQGFPDAVVSILLIINEENMVILHFEAHGTQTGTFKEIPASQKTVKFSGAIYFKIQNEKITEMASYLDMKHLLSNLIVPIK